MPSVRVERVPVQTLGLGILGFDHLQVVYVRGDDGRSPEAEWFVIEGLREVSSAGVKLGVEGLHGATTLAEANGGATGDALQAKIGTADTRGSREIATGPDATRVWATFVAHASDIEGQEFPYIPYALPASPLPTLNSSSLISSLLYHAGLDIALTKPHKLRLSPGTETLLGTSGDDVLSPAGGFTALMGGDGSDWLTGSFDQGRIDKLYGGRGSDHFQWSTGLNIIHGGQPGLAYLDDGRDTVDYSGVGEVTIRAGSAPHPHQRPDFIANFAGGEDRLFSIEEIVWDGESDRVLTGEGAGLIEIPLTLTPGGEESGSRGDILDVSRSRLGLSIDGGQDGETCVASEVSGPGACDYRIAGAEWIIGSPSADHIRAGADTRGIEGGSGDDLIDASAGNPVHALGPRGFDMEIHGGAGQDVMISGPGRVAARGGQGADEFVLGGDTEELVIEDAEPQDRISILGPAEAHYETEGRAPNDLVMHVSRAGGEGDAHVRVLGFRDGDLGLSIDCSDGPLFLADRSENFHGGSAGEPAYAAALPWWWNDLPDLSGPPRPATPVMLGSGAHEMALVYGGEPQYSDGCNTDDPDPCPW